MYRALLLVFLASPALAETSLKMATSVPRESPWGLVLRTWQKAVKEKTKGEVTIELFWNGTQGDEPAQMAKVKTGQLDGAVVTAVGLGVIDPGVNVLQSPGLYSSWEQLDKGREALRARFEQKFRVQGFELLGWGDVGLDHLMSKGFPIKNPSDLKGKRAWVWREDPVLPPLFQLAGAVTVPTSLPEALPELSTGNVTVISVSALAAEQMQWSSRLDHLSMFVVAPNIGGMVLSKKSLDALPAASRDAVLETGRVAAKALTDRIRAEDAKALERLKARMTVVEPSADDLKAWKTIFAQARERLAKGTFDATLMNDAEQSAK